MEFSPLFKQTVRDELGKYARFNPLFEALQKEETLFDNEEHFAIALNTLASFRNQLLITSEEQETLSKTRVAFFGMSVGSHAAINWTLLSRAKDIFIVDPDTIDATNLNRIRTSFTNIGESKTAVVTKELQSIQPSLTIESCSVIDDTLYETIRSGAFDVIVDEIDDMNWKLKLRALAREKKLPLLSATDVGDTVVLDVERYDINPQQQFFNNRLPGIESMDVMNITSIQRIQAILKLVGLEHCSSRMLQSLLSLGESIPTWPQLGTTANAAGSIIATTIKNIQLGDDIQSGRYTVDLHVASKMTEEERELREQLIAELQTKYSL
jgi:molybdopterin/thiamine biosynthesis adenylyltransferase